MSNLAKVVQQLEKKRDQAQRRLAPQASHFCVPMITSSAW